MGEAKRRRLARQAAGSPGAGSPAAPQHQYKWDDQAGDYRLVSVDGKPVENGPLLDMDPDELERQMQAEFERQEGGPRRRPRP